MRIKRKNKGVVLSLVGDMIAAVIEVISVIPILIFGKKFRKRRRGQKILLYTKGLKMIKTRIIYATKTKHSKKIAEAIGSALNTIAENIVSQPHFADIDLLFIVGGIYGGESKPELLEYVKKLNSSMVKSVAVVTNCGSGKQRQTSLCNTLENNGIRVVDEFVCRGAILYVALGHPNQNDLTAAIDFAESIEKRLIH